MNEIEKLQVQLEEMKMLYNYHLHKTVEWRETIEIYDRKLKQKKQEQDES